MNEGKCYGWLATSRTGDQVTGVRIHVRLLINVGSMTDWQSITIDQRVFNEDCQPEKKNSLITFLTYFLWMSFVFVFLFFCFSGFFLKKKKRSGIAIRLQGKTHTRSWWTNHRLKIPAQFQATEQRLHLSVKNYFEGDRIWVVITNFTILTSCLWWQYIDNILIEIRGCSMVDVRQSGYVPKVGQRRTSLDVGQRNLLVQQAGSNSSVKKLLPLVLSIDEKKTPHKSDTNSDHTSKLHHPSHYWTRSAFCKGWIFYFSVRKIKCTSQAIRWRP